tara:strand:- start:8214 stop:8630 length:417 start_codon:yes stop_codon:yes gene_type:complete
MISTMMSAKTPISPQIKKSPKTRSGKSISKPNVFQKYKGNTFLKKAEKINGRCAMIGFTSALTEELVTGHSLSEQFMDNIPLAIITASLVTLGTASNPKDEGIIRGQFKPEVEELNGRLAMIGMASLFISEATGNIVF